ncbi:MAG: hypothetical protein L0226_11715 [Acidobacteria bacterium]|nr:hypothetical protein [Acidobacteriota bacterium]
MVDSVPTELLELQTRFETWRANRKYVRESIPAELRSAALEMRRRYLSSLIQRVLKVDPSRLKKRPPVKRAAPRAASPKKKPQPSRYTGPSVPIRKSKSSTRAQAAALHQSAFFKLPAPARSCSSYRFAPHSPASASNTAITFCRVASDQSAVSIEAFSTKVWRNK